MPYADRNYQTFGEAPPWPGDVEWVNRSQPLQLADQRGRIVILFFWTWTNIHCVHVLDDLTALLSRFADAVTVLGIHTPKYTREQDSDSLRAALQTLNVPFPVANDRRAAIWKAYGATAWPTVCVIDPMGRVASAFAGEGHLNDLEDSLNQILEFHRQDGGLKTGPPPGVDAAPVGAMAPSRLLVDEAGKRIFISDARAHRIYIATLTGTITETIGDGVPGHLDSALGKARFHRPLGMALHEGVLYVADSGNHAIRKIDLDARTVGTFGGSNLRGNVYTMTGGPGTLMSSPSDIAIIDGVMYIAMTGTHQIWQAALKTANFRPYVGTGVLGLQDGAGPSAHLAQPCALAEGRGWLYFLDAESSALRRANLGDQGAVETIAGEDLFTFGDEGGHVRTARFQRPTGLCFHDGAVYVADTFNNKIKAVYPVSGEVDQFVMQDSAMNEPGDIAHGAGHFYIADTNNGRILMMDIANAAMTAIPLTPAS